MLFLVRRLHLDGGTAGVAERWSLPESDEVDLLVDLVHRSVSNWL